MLKILHPKLHQLPAMRRSLVEDPAPSTSPLSEAEISSHYSTSRLHGSPGWQGPGRGETQGTEHVAALPAGPLPRDEGELGPAHVARHGLGRALVPL